MWKWKVLLQLIEYTNISCFALQANITIEDVEMVVNSLTAIVGMTTERVDQNADNIQIISTIIVETASLIGQAYVKGNLEPKVIQMVSCSQLSLSLFQLYF